MRKRRRKWHESEGRPPVEAREVLSYEVSRSHALWHGDFHHGKRRVLTQSGEWKTPILLGFLDDHSRLGCHLQWYLAETAEVYVHGLCQAFMKRGLPRSLLTDNGGPMTAGEVEEGLLRLGIAGVTTLSYSPHQNGKIESFWGTAIRPAALLAPITARADEDLAPAPGTQKHPGIVHRRPRRGGLDDPQSPGNTAFGAVRTCGSGRSLGRDRQVKSVRGCAGLPGPCDLTPTPQRRHRTGARRRHLRQHRFRWEARPGRGRRDDSVCARSPFADHVKT